MYYLMFSVYRIPPHAHQCHILPCTSYGAMWRRAGQRPRTASSFTSNFAFEFSFLFSFFYFFINLTRLPFPPSSFSFLPHVSFASFCLGHASEGVRGGGAVVPVISLRCVACWSLPAINWSNEAPSRRCFGFGAQAIPARHRAPLTDHWKRPLKGKKKMTVDIVGKGFSVFSFLLL